jgi:hypothetical protein
LSFNVWKKRIQRFLQFLQDFWEGHWSIKALIHIYVYGNPYLNISTFRNNYTHFWPIEYVNRGLTCTWKRQRERRSVLQHIAFPCQRHGAIQVRLDKYSSRSVTKSRSPSQSFLGQGRYTDRDILGFISNIKFVTIFSDDFKSNFTRVWGRQQASENPEGSW